MTEIKGYKIFNPDWTCRGKQYTCPGIFEEDVKPDVCNCGMHFCKNAADCFNYYSPDPNNKVAEVIALGDVMENDDKCATNKLQIVREVPWDELLKIVNTGKDCTGVRNSGNRNSGDFNSGDFNGGNRNSGDFNSGDFNGGNRNSGDFNSGNFNSGNRNSGDFNSGNWNSGNRNSGDFNSGDWNSGDFNSGDWNSGDCNSGNWNSGDWNKTCFSNGCFNTEESKIYLFNKPSNWTYRDWLNSQARWLMQKIPCGILDWVRFGDMTDEEKAAHPEAETTGGYLKPLDNSESAKLWWQKLSDDEKNIIKSIPNFDEDIFKEIVGVDVGGARNV